MCTRLWWYPSIFLRREKVFTLSYRCKDELWIDKWGRVTAPHRQPLSHRGRYLDNISRDSMPRFNSSDLGNPLVVGQRYLYNRLSWILVASPVNDCSGRFPIFNRQKEQRVISVLIQSSRGRRTFKTDSNRRQLTPLVRDFDTASPSLLPIPQLTSPYPQNYFLPSTLVQHTASEDAEPL